MRKVGTSHCTQGRHSFRMAARDAITSGLHRCNELRSSPHSGHVKEPHRVQRPPGDTGHRHEWQRSVPLGGSGVGVVEEDAGAKEVFFAALF